MALPPSVQGLKFQFLKKDEGSIPNNCPVVTDAFGDPINDDPAKGVFPATKEFKPLGIYPVTRIMSMGFRDDKQFDWKGYWEDQCSDDEFDAEIDVDDLLDDFDRMQKAELGDLVTGTTTFTGDIGQKAVRDGNKPLYGKIYEQLMGFADYIEGGLAPGGRNKFPGSKKKNASCTGKERLNNCDDAISRTFFGVGKMTVAAVESGLAAGKRLSPALVNRTIGSPGTRATGANFEKDPYTTGAETLLRCMIESEDGSLKRDICTEMLKDVAVAGIKKNEPGVYTDVLNHLAGYYDEDFFAGRKETWDNLKTWVNATVWMAGGLIDVMGLENAREISRSSKGTKMLIDAIASQKKEGLLEFSTADWIVNQALIITSSKKIFDKHADLIKTVNESRLRVWNPWLDLYLKNFDTCPADNKNCMGDADSPPNEALKQLSKSIVRGCLDPVAREISRGKREADLDNLDKDALNNCSKAIGTIIRKAGSEDVLSEATKAYFLYGQEGAGKVYLETVKKNLEQAINDRFTDPYVRSMDFKINEKTGKMDTAQKRDPIEEEFTVIEPYMTKLFHREPRLYKITPEGPLYAKYLLEVKSVEGRAAGTKIVRDESSPIYNKKGQAVE